jgi:hypothetical protein
MAALELETCAGTQGRGVIAGRRRATVQPSACLTLAAYGEAKQLPVDFLQALGLKQAELRAKLARGERVSPRAVKFKEAAAEWFESKRHLRPWTRKSYRSALDRVLLPRFGQMKLGQITPEHLAKLIRELEQQGLSASYIEELLKPRIRRNAHGGVRVGWCGCAGLGAPARARRSR